MTEKPPFDKNAPGWRELRLWLGARIQRNLRELSTPGLDPSAYDVLRGRIAADKDLINAVQPKAEAEGDAEPDYFD